MTQIYTQCPFCQTSFKIAESQLSAANGAVRCGACLEIFSAPHNRITLKDSPLPTPENEAPVEIEDVSVEIEVEPNKPVEPVQINEKVELHQALAQLQDEESLETLQPEAIAAIDEPLEILHSGPHRSRLMSFSLILSNLLFILILLAQYGWANIETVMQDQRLNPVTDIFCQYLDCPEKRVLNLNFLATEDLFIRSHPTIDNALQVDFIFSNNASFEQNFPLAELSFTDTDNRLLASRQFTPLEYLPQDLGSFARMPANTSIQISLEIVDPGEQAINYSLNFK
jgi:predicted Zn finger-like uncharacterized protein